MKKSEYAEKFKDVRWQKKRLEIFDRDGWRCVKCGDDENTLHVHHRYYDWGKYPWMYENDSLVTLCAECHEGESELMKSAEVRLERAIRMNFLGADADMIAEGFWNIDKPKNANVFAIAFMRALLDKSFVESMIKKYYK